METLATIKASELVDVLSPEILVGDICDSLTKFRREWQALLQAAEENGTAISLLLDGEHPVFVLSPSVFAAFGEKRRRLAGILMRMENLPADARPFRPSARRVSALAESSSKIQSLRRKMANKPLKYG